MLGRPGVVNRGIGGDRLLDMILRTHGVTRLKPRYVFIMAGINDLRYGASAEETLERYKKLVSLLVTVGTKPIVQSVLYTNMAKLNISIDTLERRTQEVQRRARPHLLRCECRPEQEWDAQSGHE